MPAAIRSVFSASVALAGAGVIAVSPVLAPAGPQLPTVQAPSIELTAASVPALGALPYQILVNQLASLVAVGPILAGSTEQCVTCLGPVPVIPGSTALPFTGWGAIGLGVGLLTSPFAFFDALSDTFDVIQALGVAGLAIQTPITNTLALLQANRELFGGFELQGALDRAFIALKHTIDYTLNITAQALVSGPLTIIGGVVIGLQTFFGTLAVTGDLAAAFSAGRVPVNTAVTESLAALFAETQEARATVYADLTAGPTGTRSPIPTVPAPTAAAAAAQPATPTVPGTETPTPVAAAAGTGDTDLAPTSADVRPTAAPEAPADPGATVSRTARDAVARARTAGAVAGRAVGAEAGAPRHARSATARSVR